MLTLAIVIVAWNVRDLLRRCLAAVAASLATGDQAATVLVVDNASSDGTAAMLRAEFPHVHLLEPGRNLGFAAGNNLALRALGFGLPATQSLEMPRPDAVLLLNPDTEPLGDALPRLVRYLAANPDVLAVGPRLWYADGSEQSSRRRWPERATFFWESTPLQRWWPGNPWARRYHCADQPGDTEQRVDWLVGAALLVRSAAIERAGLLDEGFFLYSEEVEWQHRLAHAWAPGAAHQQGSVAYLPTAALIHHEGRSSLQVPAARHIHFQRSRLRLAALWYGPTVAACLRLFLLLCYLWELVSEGAKYCLGHRRDLRRQRLRIYALVLSRL